METAVLFKAISMKGKSTGFHQNLENSGFIFQATTNVDGFDLGKPRELHGDNRYLLCLTCNERKTFDRDLFTTLEDLLKQLYCTTCCCRLGREVTGLDVKFSCSKNCKINKGPLQEIVKKMHRESVWNR